MKWFFTLVLLCLVALAAAAQEANTRYVTDNFTVTVRSGRGTEYQVLRTIPSGTPVEVLEAADNGYAHVRLEDGLEGWVLSRYLTDRPIARERLAAARSRLDSLAAENARLEEQVQALRAERAELESRLQRLGELRRRLGEENEALRAMAEHPQQLQAENESLQQKLVNIEERARLLQEKASELEDTTKRDWFLAGAGVLLGGLVLGVIVGRTQLRRRSTLFRS